MIKEKFYVDVPKSLLKHLEGFRKDKKASYLKMYHQLSKMSQWPDKDGLYFPVPSTYLKSVHWDYRKIIKFYIDNNYLSVKGSLYNDEYYSIKYSICKRYKLENVDNLVEVEYETKWTLTEWYKIITNSLKHWGIQDPYAKADDYSGRVYHTLSQEYKIMLHDQGFVSIDAHACHVHLLLEDAERQGFHDQKMRSIIDSKQDFYEYLVNNFVDKEGKPRYKTRQEAKDAWQIMLYNKGRMWTSLKYIFPQFYEYLCFNKDVDDKYFSRRMQRMDRVLFIDNILVKLFEEYKMDFIIPIHDSIIVNKDYQQDVLKFLNEQYPKYKFKCEHL